MKPFRRSGASLAELEALYHYYAGLDYPDRGCPGDFFRSGEVVATLGGAQAKGTLRLVPRRRRS